MSNLLFGSRRGVCQASMRKEHNVGFGFYRVLTRIPLSAARSSSLEASCVITCSES
jgi:hypothetical protein